MPGLSKGVDCNNAAATVDRLSIMVHSPVLGLDLRQSLLHCDGSKDWGEEICMGGCCRAKRRRHSRYTIFLHTQCIIGLLFYQAN